MAGPDCRDLHRTAASFMLIEEALDKPPVRPLALRERSSGPAPTTAEVGRAIPVLICGKRAACWVRRGRLAAAVARLR